MSSCPACGWERSRFHQCPPLWEVWLDGNEDEDLRYIVHAISSSEAAERACEKEYAEWDAEREFPKDSIFWVRRAYRDDPAIKFNVSVEYEPMFWAQEEPA